MFRAIRRTRPSRSAIAAALLAGALLAPGVASARTSSQAQSSARTSSQAQSSARTSSQAQWISGDFSSGPFTIEVSAHRAAGTAATAATGTFTGTLGFAGAKAGDFMGPVTCLDVVGNRAGLFYPVTSADPSAVASVPFGVLVTVSRTSSGRPQSVTFLPVPETHVSSCAPQAALLPITSGTLTFAPERHTVRHTPNS